MLSSIWLRGTRRRPLPASYRSFFTVALSQGINEVIMLSHVKSENEQTIRSRPVWKEASTLCRMGSAYRSGIQRYEFSTDSRECVALETSDLCVKESLDQITDELLKYDPKGSSSTKQLRHFNEAMDSWAKFLSVIDADGIKTDSRIQSQAASEAARRADELFLKLERSDSSSLTPTVVTYNSTMHVWARAARYIGKDAAVKAEEILERMISNYHRHNKQERKWNGEGTAQPPSPTIITFNTVIDAYAKAGGSDAGVNAERILRRMETWFNSEGRDDGFMYPDVLPNTHSFSSVIEAHANSGQGIAAANRAQVILDEMISLHAKADDHGKILAIPNPDAIVYNSVINAWCKSGGGIAAAEKAEQLLESMMQLGGNVSPTTRSFSLVIDCWAKSRCNDAPLRAEKVFRRMEDHYHKGHDTRPNKVTFTSLIETWAESNTVDSAEKANALLERMLQLYEETRDKQYAPSIVTFNVVINAWAKSSDHEMSVEGAVGVLDRMKELSQKFEDESILPDVISYNTLIKAISRKGGPEAATRAQNLLADMENNATKPNIDTYNSVLNCMAKSGESAVHLKVSSFLKAMEERCMSNDESAIHPDRVSYTTLIDAISRSGLSNQAELAREALNRMFDLYHLGNRSVQPDIYAFTSVLNACARTHGDRKAKRKALKHAIQTFEELQRLPFVEPNSITYGTMANAISSLTEKTAERDRLLENIFQQCCQRGLVNQRFLDIFQDAASRELSIKLFGSRGASQKLQLSQVNPSWSSNCHAKKFRRGRTRANC